VQALDEASSKYIAAGDFIGASLAEFFYVEAGLVSDSKEKCRRLNLALELLARGKASPKRRIPPGGPLGTYEEQLQAALAMSGAVYP
jgi:hypothetical protein